MISNMRRILLVICSSKEALPSLLSPLLVFIGASDDALMLCGRRLPRCDQILGDLEWL